MSKIGVCVLDIARLAVGSWFTKGRRAAKRSETFNFDKGANSAAKILVLSFFLPFLLLGRFGSC
jgi:hypothetical protein